jgi:oxygen-dependent protoporphyrinogen oxidase
MNGLPDQVDVAIVGAGLAGLTVAWRLQQNRPDLSIVVLERSSRPGGKIRSERVEHAGAAFVVEAGPDAFLAQKPWAKQLIDDIGLGDQLLPVTKLDQAVSILRNGRIIAWPSGISLVAPTELKPFLRTPLISWRGKVRMARDLLLPTGSVDGDESIASFARRRLGQEAVDWIAEPLLAGIYSADPEEVSLQATFPHLKALEEEHGSLIRGLRATKRRRALDGPPLPTFLSLKNGMESLPHALATRLGEDLKTGVTVSSVTDEAEGFRLFTARGRSIACWQIVYAVPATVTATLLPESARTLSDAIGAMQSSSSGTLSLAYRDEQITRPISGYGLVLPGKEGRAFNAITVTSRKFAERAPAGWTLLRLFFGGARSPATMSADDQHVLDLAQGEVRELLGVTGEPAFWRISRYPVGNPVYEVGHLARVAAIERDLPEGIHLAGAAWYGVGIPDVVRQSNEIANRIGASLPASKVRDVAMV